MARVRFNYLSGTTISVREVVISAMTVDAMKDEVKDGFHFNPADHGDFGGANDPWIPPSQLLKVS